MPAGVAEWTQEFQHRPAESLRYLSSDGDVSVRDEMVFRERGRAEGFRGNAAVENRDQGAHHVHIIGPPRASGTQRARVINYIVRRRP